MYEHKLFCLSVLTVHIFTVADNIKYIYINIYTEWEKSCLWQESDQAIYIHRLFWAVKAFFATQDMTMHDINTINLCLLLCCCDIFYIHALCIYVYNIFCINLPRYFTFVFIPCQSWKNMLFVYGKRIFSLCGKNNSQISLPLDTLKYK